jgi:mitogen-activated protein kinase organizer 1
MAEPVQDLIGHQGPVNVACYNIDGSYLLSGGSDRTIRLWNPVTGLLVKTFTGHGKEVLGMDM